MLRWILALCFCSFAACQKSEETAKEAQPVAANFSDLEPLEEVSALSSEVRIRLILQPTFLSPLIYDFRVDASGDSGQLRVRRYSGKAGYDPGAVELDYSRELTEDESGLILAHLQESGFWELPREELVEDTIGQSGERVPLAGLDGDTYTLEAKSGDRFHSVWRWQALQIRPESDEPSDIAAISKHIIDSAGIVPFKRDSLTW